MKERGPVFIMPLPRKLTRRQPEASIKLINVTEATASDATGMSAVLAEIIARWGSSRPSSPQFVAAHYIQGPDRLRCSVARNAQGVILGFQSLKIAGPGNPYEVPDGWGVIGTYVSADARRLGVGRALFTASRTAAAKAGLRDIDATIGASNDTALAYYDAMGFATYRTLPGAICKRFSMTS